MNVEIEIKRLQAQIAAASKRIKWIKKRQKLLEQLPEGSFCGSTLDFDKLPHKDTIQVIKQLGGKWKKSPNNVVDGGHKIDYVAEVDEVRVRVWAGEPPPSCRIVEVEEIIPAHTIPEQHVPEQKRIVRKMVCTGQAEPVAVALAKAINEQQQPNGQTL